MMNYVVLVDSDKDREYSVRIKCETFSFASGSG